MANYLPVMPNQSANNWLLSLRADSIETWEDLKKVFVANYMATGQQPGTKYDLEKLHQTSGESLRSFIRRFSETRNSIPNISDSEAISACTKGLLCHEQLRGKLYHKRPATIDELLQKANAYADVEEADRASRPNRRQHRNDDRRNERRHDNRNCCHEEHDRRYDDRDHRRDDRPKGSGGRQYCRLRSDNYINTINARAKCSYDAENLYLGR
ncbi:uncharacterized protein [Miscanthus floridulus]|uniref:uncharacterized protein n=1 Tax=Miscanthus floridulus TaxID=154761 RepID=UPI00345804D7